MKVRKKSKTKKAKSTGKNEKPRKKTRRKLLVAAFSILLLILSVPLFLHFNQSASPQSIQITNVSPNSVSISWVTKIPTKGTVLVYDQIGNEALYQAFDDRDIDGENSIKENSPNKYYVHHATVRNLEPSTTYNFTIDNGFHKVSNQEINTFVTAPRSTTAPPTLPEPAYGQIILPEETFFTGSEAILYMRLVGSKSGEQSSMISTVIRPGNDTWYVDLNTALYADHTRSFLKEQLSKGDELYEFIIIEAGQLGKFDTAVGLGADAPAKPFPVDSEISEDEGGLVYRSNTIPRSIGQRWDEGLDWSTNDIQIVTQEETGSFTSQKRINTCRLTDGPIGCRGKFSGYQSVSGTKLCWCESEENADEDPLKSELSSCKCGVGLHDSPRVESPGSRASR